MDIKFEINVIGNGSASPHKTRYPSSQYVKIDNHFWLIDCGEGTQHRLLEQGLKRSKLDGIVISHLHGDHYYGLFGLLSSLAMDQRKRELTVIGPERLKEMMDLHLSQGGYSLGYEINFISTSAITDKTKVFSSGNLSIETFPLQHRIPCTGYRFNYNRTDYHLELEKAKAAEIPQKAFGLLTKGVDYANEAGQLFKYKDYTTEQSVLKSYAYCSDTAYFDELVNYILGVDLLYHEATFLEDKSQRAAETFHSTANQAATIADKGSVGRLMIGHFSSRYDEVDEFLQEAKRVFDNSILSEQGSCYSI